MNVIQKNSNELNLINCLIIDDDKFSRTFIKTALHQIGLTNIKEASSTSEAMELILNFQVDMILLDQIMPDKCGIDFVKELQSYSKENNSNLTIIMITVDTKEKTVLEAKKLGIKEYLVKPISPNSLKKRICNALNIKE